MSTQHQRQAMRIDTGIQGTQLVRSSMMGHQLKRLESTLVGKTPRSRRYRIPKPNEAAIRICPGQLMPPRSEGSVMGSAGNRGPCDRKVEILPLLGDDRTVEPVRRLAELEEDRPGAHGGGKLKETF